MQLRVPEYRPRPRPCLPTLFLGPTTLLLCLSLSCSDDPVTTPGDETPPAPVTDLQGVSTDLGVVQLTWTAVGDDGHSGRAEGQQIRASLTPATARSWDTAELVHAGRPAEPGSPQSAEVRGRAIGTWHFTLRTVDDNRNWSSISNVASVPVDGLAGPTPITDLAIPEAGDRSARLTWTAPEAPAGTPPRIYDLRYWTETLTEATWDSATTVPDVPAPAASGEPESFVVTGLEPGTTYEFALRTAVQVPNWSALSNVVSVTTANVVRLTSSGANSGAFDPDWSPDGTRIAYTSYTRGFFPSSRVAVLSVHGGPPEILTGADVSAWSPAWAPDGSTIAYVSSRSIEGSPESENGIELMSPTPGSTPIQVVSTGGTFIQRVSWSPSGTELVYLVTISIDPIETEVYTVAVNGGTPQLLLDRSVGASGRPRWSPDGSEILFNANSAAWVVPATGGAPQQIFEESLGNPDWSPDGERLVYTRFGDLWIRPRTEGNPIQITSGPDLELSPAWSPDGAYIAFDRGTRPDEKDIWMIELR